MKKIINKKENGITLIALVITIIVLLILAGVAISMLSGENGILKQAAKAKFMTEVMTIKEELALKVSEDMAESKGETGNINGLAEDYLESAKKYAGKFKIVDNELKYINGNFTDEEIGILEGNGILEEKEIITATNLFNINDPETLQGKYFIKPEQGSDEILIRDNSSYVISHYIPVEKDQTLYYDTYNNDFYTLLGSEVYCRNIIMYDNQKNFIYDSSIFSAKYTGKASIPEGVTFIRLMIPTKFVEGFIVSTSPITEYIEYGDTIVEKQILAHIASKYDVAVGKNVNLYNVNICPATLKYNIKFDWECDIGTVTENGISFTPEEKDIGEHTATLKVYSDNKLYSTNTTTINVVEDKIDTEMNVVCLGDSLTKVKLWIPLLSTYSNSKITSIGTISGAHKSSMLGGEVVINHEGRAGWTASMYLSSQLSGEDTNAFYDTENSEFSYSYYKNTTGYSPDAVIVFLGRNSMQSDPTDNVNDITSIVNKIREDDADVSIYVVNTIRDNAEYKTSIASLNLMRKLNENIKDIDNCHIIPLQTCYDAVTYTDASTDSVHPATGNGYVQFANVIYSAICANQ